LPVAYAKNAADLLTVTSVAMSRTLVAQGDVIKQDSAEHRVLHIYFSLHHSTILKGSLG
jgi:hypothetical protein